MTLHPPSARSFSSGVPLRNHLLAAIPDDAYRAISSDLRPMEVAVGQILQNEGMPVRDVYFPNAGVYSVTKQMRDGRTVEVATVGSEGMLGVTVFLGDPIGTGEIMLQVPEGQVTAMTADAFVAHASQPGPFRDIIGRYTQAHLVQVMQCTACNALHKIEERCCRWLLQTHDRIGQDEFVLKHEFLAVMLGVTRPSVTMVLGTLQKAGLITSHYGRIRVLDRKQLEAASCECYEAIAQHFERLGIGR